MSENKGLSLVKRAGQMLAEARTFEEFKTVRDVGEAAIRLAKSRRDVGIEALLDAQEIVRRTERQLGAMLPKVISHGGDKARLQAATLVDLGIEKTQSSRFQKIAQLPDEKFEAWVSQCRESGEELTQAAALRLAAEFLADPIEKPERELCVLAWEALSSAYAKYADKLGKDDRLFVLERLESLVRLIKQEASPDASRGQGSGRAKAANAAG